MAAIKKQLNISSKYYKYILRCLQSLGGTSRLVGGCVRDSILEAANSDIDIATTLLPEQVIELLTKQNINVVPIGIQFGTVSAFFEGEKFEITTLRKDITTDGRRAIVAFSKDFQEDAARRDFTINALSYCPFEEKIYDYFGGIDDLKNGKVIFIGDPSVRIKEDYLRILRFFRFSCRYAKYTKETSTTQAYLDEKALAACIDLRHNIKHLSKERIKSETDKLIEFDNSFSILKKMFEKDILQMIFPIKYFNANVLERAIDFASQINFKLGLPAKYATIFNYLDNIKITFFLQLKFPRNESAEILDMINFCNKFCNYNIAFMLKKIWLEKISYLQYIAICYGLGKLDLPKAREFINKYNSITRPQFPITGNDLLKQNIQGKQLGDRLAQLKNFWIDSDFKLTKDQLLQIECNNNARVKE